MQATFTTEIPEGALDSRDPRAIFQRVLTEAVYPVGKQIADTARASTRHQGVAQAYQPGASAIGDKVTVWVENLHPLFRIIEGGSKPHIIAAKNKPYLMFMGNRGHVVSVREVSHPGTRPMRPLANAFAAHRGDTQAAIQEGAKEWLSESLGGSR